MQPDNVGWKSYLQEDPTEFQDIPLLWEEETPVPAWLSGTYVRWPEPDHRWLLTNKTSSS